MYIIEVLEEPEGPQMLSIAFRAAVAFTLIVQTANLIGQQNAKWINKEFIVPSDLPSKEISSFINESCQPSDLDGIQLLAVQTGHSDAFHLHVFCRVDKAAATHYELYTVPVGSRSLDEAIGSALSTPSVHIGPLFFGKVRADDQFLVLRRTA